MFIPEGDFRELLDNPLEWRQNTATLRIRRLDNPRYRQNGKSQHGDATNHVRPLSTNDTSCMKRANALKRA
jgi:hypothetical protein